jgi:phospholipid/cholesterol/gamma-HCH transport system ATP-binding protein
MIEITQISTEHLAPVSLSAAQGEVCKVITNSEFLGTEFMEAVSMQRECASGSVNMFGQQMHTSSALLRQAGFVWRDGGLLSNLKLWENIVLPVCYHYGTEAHELEPRVLEIYSKLGRTESDIMGIINKSPGALPAYENMYAGLIRTYLMAPDVIFYDAMFEGLSAYFADMLMDLTQWYHNEKPQRVSVYLATDAKLLEGLSSENIVQLRGLRTSNPNKD